MIKNIIHSLRTVVFYALWILFVVPWCTLVILTVYAVPVRLRHPFFIKTFCLATCYLCRWICGVRWRVEGLEHIPKRTCIVASNHQSPWETFFLQILVTPQSTVIKKELFSVPFFGWAFRRLNPIAIDRNDRRSAMQQVIEKGKVCLSDNYWVVIFPEGTRYQWPGTGRFSLGAATLAQYANVPILPVVHDAGKCWPSFRWKKKPGEITVRFGAAIDSQNKSVKALTNEVRDWIIANRPAP